MNIKFSVYLFLFYYFVINIKSLDVNENSDEIEIFKHLFVKLNTILERNDLVQKDLTTITHRLEQLEQNFNQIPEKNYVELAASCNSSVSSSLLLSSSSSSLSTQSSDNYCFGKDWIVIQRRIDGTENFFRNWNDYKLGFGNRENEFFVGLEKIHKLTSEATYELLIIMEDYENSKRYAKYNQFEIGSEQQGYILKTLGTYSGNAGDSLTYHKGLKFSTHDRDNDEHAILNCAKNFQSAWWFKACFESNLNGCYSDINSRDTTGAVACGVHWRTFRGQWYSLKYVEMLIRRKV